MRSTFRPSYHPVSLSCPNYCVDIELLYVRIQQRLGSAIVRRPTEEHDATTPKLSNKNGRTTSRDCHENCRGIRRILDCSCCTVTISKECERGRHARQNGMILLPGDDVVSDPALATVLIVASAPQLENQVGHASLNANRTFVSIPL